jgi:hypothetical protein
MAARSAAPRARNASTADRTRWRATPRGTARRRGTKPRSRGHPRRRLRCPGDQSRTPKPDGGGTRPTKRSGRGGAGGETAGGPLDAEDERRPYPTAGETLRRDEPHERRRASGRVPMEHPNGVPARSREARAGPVRDGAKNRPANDPRGMRSRISRPEIESHERMAPGRAHTAPPADQSRGRERGKDVARALTGRARP